MVGWIQDWDHSHTPIKGQRWMGQMALPRELSVRNGRLVQVPVRELERYHWKHIYHEITLSDDEIELQDVHGRILDRFSVEVFVNDGEQALCAAIYTPQTDNSISFEVHGQILLKVEKYHLFTGIDNWDDGPKA